MMKNCTLEQIREMVNHMEDHTMLIIEFEGEAEDEQK